MICILCTVLMYFGSVVIYNIMVVVASSSNAGSFPFLFSIPLPCEVGSFAALAKSGCLDSPSLSIVSCTMPN